MAVIEDVMETTPSKGERQQIRKKRILVVDDPSKSRLSTLKLLVALVIFVLFIWLAMQVR